MTIGEKYGPAMEITDQATADAYFEECVKHRLCCLFQAGLPTIRAEAERTERMNLGYFAGYCDHETRERVERLFKCSHPIFGSCKKGSPTPIMAMSAGMASAKTTMKANPLPERIKRLFTSKRAQN